MNRFEKKQNLPYLARPLLSGLLFLAVTAVFYLGLNSASGSTSAQEAANLRGAVLRGAVQCYALEGFYPEDISYLEERYNVSYDREKYVVSYEVIGSNLMPDVTVIPLTGNRKGDPS